jgi:hypothetical protein
MKELPSIVLTVPGQHDLPNHRYDDMKRSSYYTLVLSQAIDTIRPGERAHIKGNWYAYGYPWGYDNIEELDLEEGEKALAVIHSYIWKGDNKYTDAPNSKHVCRWQKKLSNEGFNAAVFGDNHKGFFCMTDSTDQEGPWIINCGTFIRRTIDEINYRPRVGILHDKGYIEEHYLDCEKDKFIDVSEALEAIDKALEATDFIRELSGLGKTVVDFCDAVERFCSKNGIDKRIVELINRSMEKKL